MEDGYSIVIDKSTNITYFVEPFSFRRYGDSLIADFISYATDLKRTHHLDAMRGLPNVSFILLDEADFFLG